MSNPALDLRLVGVALAAWAAAWCGLAARPGATLIVAGGAALTVTGLGMLRCRGSAVVAGVLIGVSAGAAASGLRVWGRDHSPVAGLARQRAAVTVSLVVTDDPRRVVRSAAAVPAPLIIPARITAVTVRGKRTLLGGRLVVFAADGRWATLLPSQRVRTVGRLSAASGDDLSVARLSARGPPVKIGRPSALQRGAGALRSGLRAACRSLPAKERGLLPGLVIGDTARLDPALARDFRTTGLTHLVAVSGTNCAIVSGAVLLLVRRLRAGPRVAAIAAAAALLGFVVLARPSPSVLRAAVMGALALLALFLGRPRAAVPGLCAAVFVLVLADPTLTRSAGFTLSVLATAGLLLLAPGWRDRLRRRLPGGVAEAVAVPAAAQVACAPIIAAISGQVAIIAVPANLLAAVAVAPATLLGVAATVLSVVWLPAATLAARVAAVPTWWLVVVAEHGAAIPGGTFGWPSGSHGALLLATVLLLGLFAARRPTVRRAAISAAFAAAAVAVPMRTVQPGWPPTGWVMVVCNVGQGDALVLNAGSGSAVVVDTGPEPTTVDRCLRRLRVVRVPLLVITHLHADHVGGLAGVVKGRRLGQIEVGPLREPDDAWQHLQQEARATHVRLVGSAVGEVRDVGALRLRVLAPRVALRGTRSDPNNSSIMLLVSVAGRRLLLAGDAEVEEQSALLRDGGDLRADVLKVAHHGSPYQDPRFLAAVHPSVALVSVGAGNRYGHPSPAVLRRLQSAGAYVRRTDRDGDLAVTVHGRALGVVVDTRSNPPGRPRIRATARGPPRRVRPCARAVRPALAAAPRGR